MNQAEFEKLITAKENETVEFKQSFDKETIETVCAFEFTGEIQRNEILEYPKEALRELVLNAIIHRDYMSPIDIQIKIFDQAITIFNPGRLYGDVTIEKLKTDSYQSRTRNKLIAEAFYLTKDIEKYGSGYIRVREAIQEYPTMVFEYEESGDGYIVTLRYDQQKTTQKTTQDKIIQFLSDNPQMKIFELSDKIGIGRDAINQHIATLKKDGILKRVGGRKSGHWEIVS